MKRFVIAAAFSLFALPAFAQSSSIAGSNSGAYINAPNNSINIPSKSLRTVGNAIAPSMAAAGIDNCAGSASLGVGVMGLGLSGGYTYTMTPCDIRAMARALRDVGQPAAALHYMAANDEKLKASLAAVGAIVLTNSQGQPAAAYANTRQASARSVAPGKPGFCSNPQTYSPALCN